MKVLLINHFPLEGSGSGTYTKNIALHLRKRGHEVCVIFPENRPVLMLPGIRMFPVMFSTGKASWSSLPFNFPCFTTHPQSRTTFADLSSGELAQYLTIFSSVLRQAVREFQPDVIHAQHAWCLSWLASLCDIPLVVTIHGTDLMGCRKWPVFRGFAEEAIAGSAKVLAISQDNRELALSVLPSCANRLLLLPNGYNEDIFYPEEVDRESLFKSLDLPYRGEYIVLFAGKLAEFKGVDSADIGKRAIYRHRPISGACSGRAVPSSAGPPNTDRTRENADAGREGAAKALRRRTARVCGTTGAGHSEPADP